MDEANENRGTGMKVIHYQGRCAEEAVNGGGNSVDGRWVGRAGCVVVVRRIEVAWGFAISRWSLRDWGFLKVTDTPAMSMCVPSTAGLL